MKTLLTEKSIRDLIAQGATSVCIDENTIVTPAAKDAIKYNGDALSTEMIYNALKKMTEQGLLNGCFEAPASAEAAPYTAENANGFKLVRGGGIKMDVLELENPADNGKVQYQELIGADVDSAMNAGFMTVDQCTFNWDVEPQEIYYVVEGNMTVTVDGVPHTAYPGDCLFIQKGSKVVFSSGNTKAKVFYCTY